MRDKLGTLAVSILRSGHSLDHCFNREAMDCEGEGELDKLISAGYVERTLKGQYLITEKGKKLICEGVCYCRKCLKPYWSLKSDELCNVCRRRKA